MSYNNRQPKNYLIIRPFSKMEETELKLSWKKTLIPEIERPP